MPKDPESMMDMMSRLSKWPLGHVMPDVASSQSEGVIGTLDLVGMSGIEVPIRLPGGLLIAARASAAVSLDDPDAKGIHMSRLFLALHNRLEEQELSYAVLRSIVEDFAASHQGLSERARLSLSYELPLRRPALVSAHSAWRSYPVGITADLDAQGLHIELSARITYSSTCPCSAALARQLIQERFDQDFAGRQSLNADELRSWLGSDQAICATPHSQRSHADVQVLLEAEHKGFDHVALIDLIEAALKTPVQAAVKREDEQEFARLNGENLMFCEDAGRRLTAALGTHPAIADYHMRVSHRESLHPHDAMSVAVKGVEGGYRP